MDFIIGDHFMEGFHRLAEMGENKKNLMPFARDDLAEVEFNGILEGVQHLLLRKTRQVKLFAVRLNFAYTYSLIAVVFLKRRKVTIKFKNSVGS
jgi:hypothetical protein